MAIANSERQALPADEFLKELEDIRRRIWQGRDVERRQKGASKEEIAAAKRKRLTGGAIQNHKFVAEKWLECEDKELRRLNLLKMIDEFGQQTVGVGLPSHPRLFRWEAAEFGIDDEEADRLEKEDMDPERLLWSTTRVALHRESSWPVKIAMSLALEGLQLNPDHNKQRRAQIDETKREYAKMGIKNVDRAVAFDEEHAGVDVDHAQICVRAIREHITTPELQDEFRRAFILTLQYLNNA